MNKSLIIVYSFILYSSILKAQYIPLKKANISNEIYDEYCTLLKKTYFKNQKRAIDYNIALCYAHLGEPKDSVFHYLERSFQNYPQVACHSVNNNFLIKNNTGKHIFEKIDSVRWLNFCQKCQLYISHQNPVFDTIKDLHLANILTEIMINDQKFRTEINDFTKQKDENSLWTKQQYLDSVNLERVDSIFKIYEYPGKSKVGHKLANVCFFVVHHAPTVEIKEKYLHLIIKAVKENELSPSLLRLMLDRIFIERFNKQIFGTQQTSDPLTSKIESPPIASKKEIQQWLEKWDILSIYQEFSK